jgi:hypothetical protein
MVKSRQYHALWGDAVLSFYLPGNMTDNKNIELTPLRADLGRAVALRGERLLVSADLAAEVALLEPLEAYYIVRALGLGQSLPILLQLSHEQLEACVDLDCWNRHDFAADSLDEWLTAFSLAGPEELAEAFFNLDYVVQLLYLAQTVIVFDPDTDEVIAQDEDDEDAPLRAMTPDGFYLLELKTDLVLQIHPFGVLDALYQYDLAQTHQLLSEVRVDLLTQIEEEALRFRNGRMEDIGFVAPDEAAVLFSRPSTQQIPRTAIVVDSDLTRLPAVYASSLLETSLLQQALALVTDPACLGRLQQEIGWAINGAIIAYGERTQDIDQITDIAKRVRDTFCLGLESLMVKDDAACLLDSPAAIACAADLLEIWCISDLFRHGFAATLDLQHKVRKGLDDPHFLAWYELEDAQQFDDSDDRLERAFVTALLGRHPLYSGFDLARPEDIKAFACLDDVDVATVRLQRLLERVCHDR